MHQVIYEGKGLKEKGVVLVVDDEEGIRESIRMILSDDYEVLSAPDGEVALKILKARDLDLVFLDIRMPGMDGMEFLRRAKGIKPDVEIIIITAFASLDTAVEALRYGVMDYIEKPFRVDRIIELARKGVERRRRAQRIRAMLEEIEQFKSQMSPFLGEKAPSGASVKNIEEYIVQTLISFVRVIDIKDAYTKSHSLRVAYISRSIAMEMGLDRETVGEIAKAGLVHDIGKIGIDERILRKPGPLAPGEFEIMKRHPELGCKVIEPLSILRNAIPMVRGHHERYEGLGYPNGLRGDEIPLGARIIAVADVYDAMRSDRSYRKAYSHSEAKEYLKRAVGTHFDKWVAEVFLKIADPLSEELDKLIEELDWGKIILGT
jgi:putative two-component system response regulator